MDYKKLKSSKSKSKYAIVNYKKIKSNYEHITSKYKIVKKINIKGLDYFTNYYLEKLNLVELLQYISNGIRGIYIDTETIKYINNNEINYDLLNNMFNRMNKKLKKGGVRQRIETIKSFSALYFNNVPNIQTRLDEIDAFITATSNDIVNPRPIDPETNMELIRNNYIDDLLNHIRLIAGMSANNQAIYNANSIISDIIRANNGFTDLLFRFNVNKYDLTSYNSMNMNLRLPNYQFKKRFYFGEYNKALILGFENGLYETRTNSQEFITEQIPYIEGLIPTDKRCVRDFIRPNAYSYYISPFKRNNFDIQTIINNRPNGDPQMMSDSFASFVNDYIEANIKGAPIYTANIINRNLIDDFQNKYRNDTLQNSPLCHRVYYEILTTADWNIILQSYTDRLNFIIQNAPPVSKPLFAYRGSTFNYMRTTRRDNISNIPYYESTSIDSYSFNYHASLFFYNDMTPLPAGAGIGFNNQNSIIYRVVVNPGTRALFVTPFNEDPTLNSEMEFITATGQLITYDRRSITTNIDMDEDPMNIVYESRNSINNTNSFALYDEDRIKTVKSLILLPLRVVHHPPAAAAPPPPPPPPPAPLPPPPAVAPPAPPAPVVAPPPPPAPVVAPPPPPVVAPPPPPAPVVAPPLPPAPVVAPPPPPAPVVAPPPPPAPVVAPPPPPPPPVVVPPPPAPVVAPPPPPAPVVAPPPAPFLPPPPPPVAAPFLPPPPPAARARPSRVNSLPTPISFPSLSRKLLRSRSNVSRNSSRKSEKSKKENDDYYLINTIDNKIIDLSILNDLNDFNYIDILSKIINLDDLEEKNKYN